MQRGRLVVTHSDGRRAAVWPDWCPAANGPRQVHQPRAGPARARHQGRRIALFRPHSVVLCFSSARAARRRTRRLPQPPGTPEHASQPHHDTAAPEEPLLLGRSLRGLPPPIPSGVGLRVERRSATAWIDLWLVRNPSLLGWILLSANSIP